MSEQPMPTPGGASVTEALIAFLREREAKGIATYGQSLTTFNGRNVNRDLREELIDALQYAQQQEMQWEAERAQLIAARDRATADLLALGRELRQAREERDRLLEAEWVRCGSTYQDEEAERITEALRETESFATGLGCRRPLKMKYAFRCAECGRWFDRECIVQHFGTHTTREGEQMEIARLTKERDCAVAEAAVLRYAVERIEDKTAFAASRQERVDAGIVWALANNVLLADSPLAAHAAAVLAASLDWQTHGKAANLNAAVDAYRAASAGKESE